MGLELGARTSIYQKNHVKILVDREEMVFHRWGRKKGG